MSERPPQHRICRSTASRSPVLTRAGICVPPTVTYLPYRVSRSTLTAVGRARLLTRWPGTHSRILSEIQRAARTVLEVYLKRTCSRVTSASSALGVLNDYALYKSTHSLSYSLTPSGTEGQIVSLTNQRRDANRPRADAAAAALYRCSAVEPMTRHYAAAATHLDTAGDATAARRPQWLPLNTPRCN